MELSTILEYFTKIVLPLLLTWIMGELIRLARSKTAEVQDEILRAKLLELVRAAEQMIPGHRAGQARFNQVRAGAPLDITREQIEAAVKRMKEAESK